MRQKIFVALSALLAVMYLTSVNCGAEEAQNSITVSARGTLNVKPDVVMMNIRISHTAPTTKEAKTVVQNTLDRLIALLSSEKIQSRDIKMRSLNYEKEYEYTDRGRKPLGYRAEQNITVMVDNLGDKSERFSSVLDKVVSLDKIEIQGISFDVKQKADLYKQSRELAYNKALEKAKDYARLSGRALGEVLSITEEASGDVASEYHAKSGELMLAEVTVGSLRSARSMPMGEYEIRTDIRVIFRLK